MCPADTHIPPASPVKVWALEQGQAQMLPNQGRLLTRPACALSGDGGCQALSVHPMDIS